MISIEAERAATALSGAVDGLLTAELGALSPLDLAELISGLEAHRRRLDAVDVLLVRALSAVAVPADFGATSVPDLIGGLTRVGRGEARARAQRAVDLGPRRTVCGESLEPIHPLTAAALTMGEISAAHVDVITRYPGRIPAPVANETIEGVHGPRTVFEAAEAFLVDAARHEDPGALRRSGELLLARLDPDGVEPRDAEQDRQRSFGIGSGGRPNGVHGSFTDENKAVWQAILDSLSAPQPGPDGEPDSRTATQRHHDGLLRPGCGCCARARCPTAAGLR